MSLTSLRLNLFTDSLLKQYIENGILPDELQIQSQLLEEFASFYNNITNTFTINQPLWQLTNLSFRDTGIASQWNSTQQSAAIDTQIAYQDMLETANTLTEQFYLYITRSNLIQSRLANINSLIQNLLLISNDTQGYTYAFYDNFATSNFVSYIPPFNTTVAIKNSNNTASLIENSLGTPSSSGPTSLVNLLFLQNNPQDISFAVLNPVQNITPLSSAQLSDIFNNAATAWQQNVTINGNGPMVSQLTVRISPLGSIPISQINIATKMTNPNNQLLIQTLYSADGVSYLNVPSATNPQLVGQSFSINFNTIEAAYIRFIITKNIPDQGNTYNIGFQYINFVQTTYLLSGNLYSTPISLPSSGIISKIAITPCAIIPSNTNINYYINYTTNNQNIQVPISSSTDMNPLFNKIVDVNSLGNVNTNIATSRANLIWQSGSGSLLHINVTGLVPATSNINIADPSITQTMAIYRNIGPSNVIYNPPPSGLKGFQLVGSGLWATYASVANSLGSNINLQSDSAFINGRLTNGPSSLNNGLNNITTAHLDQHQLSVSSSGVCDYYFASVLKYQSLFDFYNNFSSGDISIFTYNPNTGDILVNSIPSGSIGMLVDYTNSFNPSPLNDGTFQSSSTAISISGYSPAAGTILNAGSSIVIHVDAIGKWVNEIQVLLSSLGDTTIAIDYSIDNINWINIVQSIAGPLAQTASNGFIKLPNPVYCAYIRLRFLGGSQITIPANNPILNVYAPVFLINNQIQILPSFLLTGTKWNSIYDTFQHNSSQTYDIYDYFNSQFLQTLVPTSYQASMSGIYMPAIYTIVKSNTTNDPYINNVAFSIHPIDKEISNISFQYNGGQTGNGVTSVIFQAQLSSSSADITPELQSYTVKLV